MSRQYRFKIKRAFLIGLVVGGVSLSTHAAWNRAGVSGGNPAATDFNDTANWQDGVINGDFRTVVSNVTIRLTADYSATNGLDFAEQNSAISRHITLSGTNTLTLKATIAWYPSNTRSIMLPSNANSTVTLDRGLTVNILSGFGSIRGGTSTLFVDARVTGAGRMTSHYWGGGNPHVVLRNDANTFSGGLEQDAGQIYVSSINASSLMPSASGTNNATISIGNSPMHYIGSRTVNTARPFTIGNENNAGINNCSGCGGLNLTGTVSIGSNSRTWVSLGGISAGESLITAPLYNYDTTRLTRLEKRHSGIWRLTGANSFTGWTNSTTYHITLSGGTLIADYTNDVAGRGQQPTFRGRAHRFLL